MSTTTTHPKGVIGRNVARSRYIPHQARALPCLFIGHDPVEWRECPSLSMCSRCHMSWTEVKTPTRRERR